MLHCLFSTSCLFGWILVFTGHFQYSGDDTVREDARLVGFTNHYPGFNSSRVADFDKLRAGFCNADKLI